VAAAAPPPLKLRRTETEAVEALAKTGERPTRCGAFEILSADG
jgi:hypothetical protein